MNTITWQLSNQWKGTKIYTVALNGRYLNVEITSLGTDKLGNLKRIECTHLGVFESYTMRDIKTKIANHINTLYAL